MSELSRLAHELVRESFGPHPDGPRKGQVWTHKGRRWDPPRAPRRVKITGGAYWGHPHWNGVPSISNSWDFREIKPDGSLGKEESDYDNDRSVFYPEPKEENE